MAGFLIATDFLLSLGASAEDVDSALDAASAELRGVLLDRGIAAPATLEGFPAEFRALVRRHLEALAVGFLMVHVFRELEKDDSRILALRDQVKAAQRWLKGLSEDGNPLGLLATPSGTAATTGSSVAELDVVLPGDWSPMERF